MRPLIKRPPALQVAALCHREGDAGTEVMLVSSSSGRWILPKGWPIDGLTACEAAKQEAWEEGGVKKAAANNASAQSFLGQKRFDNGSVIPCEVKVFSFKVKKLSDNYPESERRDRIWATPARAAELVDDPGLKALIGNFAA
ncbi:NUDIX hydrolase [Yoonia tamlensis]|uniref:NUDIX hydrolase n=1 Tax=Yoonia tamlensis TaxID=390270 RepID=UPI001F60F393|nr:NUDIX hydrolase [Yoonia tamlensis]